LKGIIHETPSFTINGINYKHPQQADKQSSSNMVSSISYPLKFIKDIMSLFLRSIIIQTPNQTLTAEEYLYSLQHQDNINLSFQDNFSITLPFPTIPNNNNNPNIPLENNKSSSLSSEISYIYCIS